MVRASETLELLHRGVVALPPLSIEVVANKERAASRSVDVRVLVRWEKETFAFLVEYKDASTPKALDVAIGRALSATSANLRPMILLPYLSDKALQTLEERQVSGLDLCGNGLVVVPGRLFVLRSGAPNVFRTPVRLKNVYRGTSSLVARIFLLRPSFSTVKEIQEEIQTRGAYVALSTVSKTLKTLEEELVIGRTSNRISLLQAETLLDKLRANFEGPELRRKFIGKIERTDVLEALTTRASARKLRLALTGSGAAGLFAAAAREPVLSVYCDRMEELLAGLRARETTAFPNLEVRETIDQSAYFDITQRGMLPIASILQTYLELTSGDKRDQETALLLRNRILASVKDRGSR